MLKDLADITTGMIKRSTMSFTCSSYNSMSTSDHSKIPQVEQCDVDVEADERNSCSQLEFSQDTKKPAAAELERSDDEVFEITDKFMNLQLCATMVRDIYKNLRASEVQKRPSTDYMVKVQRDISITARAILVDWLVDVAETYRLDSETLYLTVNYLDRYLSGNTTDTETFQLLGVACLMIASKYEDIDSPSLTMFCDITDNTYTEDEVLQMESSVLNFLKYELTVPTVRSFLSLFVCADQAVTEDQWIEFELECLSSYLAELSLLDYRMLCYAPSMIAASSVFLAKYMLFPSRRPWNSELQQYTLYKPSDVLKCVRALHCLCCDSEVRSSLPAIRVKYSRHEFECVAMKFCRPWIPQEYFQDL
ncbi:cyclin-A1-1 [Daucus carota subsp. sativus]|nr:PREDICTED: cyclin-A1-1-like [Daucus carota subsp. sativus]